MQRNGVLASSEPSASRDPESVRPPRVEVKYLYQCPDCHLCFEPVGSHQHADGEWIMNEDLRRFRLLLRWLGPLLLFGPDTSHEAEQPTEANAK